MSSPSAEVTLILDLSTTELEYLTRAAAEEGVPPSYLAVMAIRQRCGLEPHRPPKK